MPNVLILAYDFPPRGGVGVMRITKWTRYLPEFGWQPTIVTVSDPGPHPDLHLLDQVRGTSVLRIPARYPPLPMGEAARVQDVSTPSSAWRRRLKPWIIPDVQVGWIPGAVRLAEARLAQGDIAALLTTGPPFSTSLAGLWLKRRHPTLPWLMDLRDLWSEGPDQRFVVQYKVNRWLEQCCLDAANHTTVVTAGIRTLMLRRLRIAPERISTIPNGFDPNDLPPETLAPAQSGPLQLCYIGTMAAHRAAAAEGVFIALRQLQAEGVTAAQLHVAFIGSFAPALHDWAAPLVAAGLVTVEGFVPHDAALARMRAAHALLLVLTDDWEGRIAHSSKLFEYLAVGRPILAVVPPGEAAQLVQGTGAGVAVAPTDVAGIADALREWLGKHAAGTLATRIDPAALRPYERREQAQHVSRLLDHITN